MDCTPPVSCPWGFPGKNTGVGCHFLLHVLFSVWVNSSLTQSNRLGAFISRYVFIENAQLVRLYILACKVHQKTRKKQMYRSLPTPRSCHHREAAVRMVCREPKTDSQGNHLRSFKKYCKSEREKQISYINTYNVESGKMVQVIVFAGQEQRHRCRELDWWTWGVGVRKRGKGSATMCKIDG